MARHRWATSPPTRSRFRFGSDRAGLLEVSDRPDEADQFSGHRHQPFVGQSASPDAGRRWTVGRGASLLVLGLALAIAFGLFVLRSGPPPAITSVALGSPSTEQDAEADPGPVGAGSPSSAHPGSSLTGASQPGAPLPGAPPGEDHPSPDRLVSTASASERLLVHVAGAVSRPGIVELDAGSRVFEALDQAGGALPDADLGAINLAAPVQDGLQIRVPLNGETLPAPPAANQGAANSGPDPAEPAPSININTAGVDELDTLPRIGPVLAERIVQWRTDHGGFARPEDLDAVPGIGEALLAALMPLVTV